MFALEGFISNFPPYLRKFQPRKSNPSLIGVILVFSGESVNPLSHEVLNYSLYCFQFFFRVAGHYKSSRAGESHPHALTDPDMNVAAHPALIVQPPPDAASASARRAPGRGGQPAGSSARSAGDAAAGVCISTVPSALGTGQDNVTLGNLPMSHSPRVCQSGRQATLVRLSV
jgi:hypothetical protein